MCGVCGSTVNPEGRVRPGREKDQRAGVVLWPFECWIPNGIFGRLNLNIFMLPLFVVFIFDNGDTETNDS